MTTRTGVWLTGTRVPKTGRLTLVAFVLTHRRPTVPRCLSPLGNAPRGPLAYLQLPLEVSADRGLILGYHGASVVWPALKRPRTGTLSSGALAQVVGLGPGSPITAAGDGLKSHTVWVRIPPGAQFKGTLECRWLMRTYSHVSTDYRRDCQSPVRPRGIRSGERCNLWRFRSCHTALAARQPT